MAPNTQKNVGTASEAGASEGPVPEGDDEGVDRVSLGVEVESEDDEEEAPTKGGGGLP